MFCITFKNTVKNLLRSPTFSFCFGVVAIVATYSVGKGSYGYFVPELKEIVYDTDPRFVLDYQTYIKHFSNALNDIMSYSLPIFTVIATALVLTRDYGDGFFEIEKASGIPHFSYLFGRLSALIAVVFTTTIVVYAYSFYLFVFTRGGVDDMSIGCFLADSVIRLLRMVFVKGLPNILFFVGLTYGFGSLLKSGIAASVCGMLYAIFCYISEFFLMASLRQLNATIFFDWFHPLPKKLTYYLYYYDTEWFEDMIAKQNTSIADVAFCISFLVGIAVVCSVISYLRLRKREV